MPVIIQEIVITATVDSSTGTAGGGATSAGVANSPPTDADARQALVQECVDEVMRILREKAER